MATWPLLCVPALRASSLEKRLFSSFAYCKHRVVCLSIIFSRHKSLTRTFLRSRSSFYFSGGVLRNPKVLKLGDVRFISFSLVACASGVTAKKPLASPGVPAPFVEKTILSPLDSLGSFARNQRFHSYVSITPKATNERDRQTTSQTQTPA